MNLSVLHGIIFLWTELHRWSEIHKPEIPSHHLSHSSTPHYKLLLFCLTFIPTRNIHPGRIQQLFNLFILSIVLLFQSTELRFHSMSLILLSLYCLKEGRKILSTFQNRKTQSSHLETHFDVKTNPIMMAKMIWKKRKKMPNHTIITVEQTSHHDRTS